MHTVVELVDIDSAIVSGPPHGFNLLAVKTRARLDPGLFRLVHNVIGTQGSMRRSMKRHDRHCSGEGSLCRGC
jgi:hypothetical protein